MRFYEGCFANWHLVSAIVGFCLCFTTGWLLADAAKLASRRFLRWRDRRRLRRIMGCHNLKNGRYRP